MIKYVMRGTPEENLKVVFAKIKEQYGIMGIPNADRYPTMKLTQIKNGESFTSTKAERHWPAMQRHCSGDAGSVS